MHRILIATDFSTRSDRALRRGFLLAHQASANIILLHVVDDDQPRQIVEAHRSETTTLLDELCKTARDKDRLNCETRVVIGDPFQGIAQASEDLRADIVLLGPHRRQLLRDIFLGTTAERTIRASAKPVLMANGFPTGQYRTVLIAMDFSACSVAAAQAAKHLGLLEQSRTISLHVMDETTGPLALASLPMQEVRLRQMQEEERTHERLSELMAKIGVGGSVHVMRPKEESTPMAIHSWGKTLNADLIVVGTHGRSGLQKWMLGSVAEGVLAHATADVLAVSAGKPNSDA